MSFNSASSANGQGHLTPRFSWRGALGTANLALGKIHQGMRGLATPLLLIVAFAAIATFVSSFAMGSESPNVQRQITWEGKEQNSKVFVILTHVKDERTASLWKKAHDSIRTFYPTDPIVLIDDNSPVPLSIEGLKNVTLIRSDYPGAGELLPYHYFLKYQWADRMIFMHDSMYLVRPFTEQELAPLVKFHWHFSDHTWDAETPIEELLEKLKNGDELTRFKQNEQWDGCFGVASLIHITVLKDLAKHYGFPNRLKKIVNTRTQRMALERVFGILLAKEGYFRAQESSNFGVIHSFPFAFHTNVSEQDLELIPSYYPGAIIKTWHGR